MSIKAYNGFLTDSLSIEKFLETIDPFRTYIKNFLTNHHNKKISEMLHAVIDLHVTGVSLIQGSILYGDLFSLSLFGTGSFDNKSFKVSIFPKFCRDDGYIGITYGSEPAHEAFMNFTGFRDYGYWSNNDNLDHIEPPKLNERRNDWIDILYNDDLLEVSVVCCEDRDVKASLEKTLEFPVPLRQRAIRVAKEKILRDWLPRDLEFSGSRFFEVGSYFEYCTSNEGMNEISSLADRYEPLIPKTVDMDLVRKIEEELKEV